MRCKLLAAAVLAAFGAVSVSAHAAPGDTTLGGKMYFDFTNISQKNSDTGKTDKTGTGTDVKRFYLSVTHQFDDIWSVNLTTDFNYSSTDGETNLFVKKAYVQGKFSKAAIFRVGSADMPWIPFVEHWYGYRFVENTLTDRLHYANSADWGAHMHGSVGHMFNYAAAVVNGGGYKHPGRSKGVDFEGRVGFSPVDGMMVAVGAYSGKLGHDMQTASASNTASRIDGMVAYASKTLRVGGEYFQAKNWGAAVVGKKDKADGYSIWGSYKVADNLSVFARYDSAKQSKDLDPKKKDTYYNAGVAFDVTKGFNLAIAYKHEKSDFSSMYNGTSHVANIKTDEIGVWGQVAF